MRRLFILLILMTTIAWGIGGCGGGGGTSSDPLGTDSLMFGHKVDATGTEWSVFLQMTARQTAILTAKVKNASGVPVAGREVTFTFKANQSGATLSAYKGNTDASGEASILYTAGTASGYDTVTASISNGAQLDTNITVVGGQKIALAASSTSLPGGQSSVLVATVTDGSGNAISGQTVSFSFVTNQSNAPALSVLNLGLTDAAGRAVAVYQAGTNKPTVTLQDAVQAVSSGASAAIALTRTADTSSSMEYSLNLAADVTSLSAGRNAIVTATLTDGDGKPAGGMFVTFSLLANNSGATLTALNNGFTDASGRATAVYTAGANNSTATLQDTIQAIANGASGAAGAIVMTRTSSTSGTGSGVRMTVTATPSSLIAGASSVIVAQVNNADGTAAAGLAVTFAFVANQSGAPALTGVSTTTDASGTAIAVYRAGSNSPGLSIQDTVSASVTGSAGAAILTRLPATGTGNRISLTLNPATTAGTPLATTTGNCILQAKVLRDDGTTPVANETVTFSIVTGGGTIAPLSVATNNSGIANAVFTAPGGATGQEAVVRAQILGTTNGGDAVGIIYW